MQNLHIHRVRSGFLVAFLILSYSTDQKKPNRERERERVQNGYRTGTRTGTERV